MGDELTVLGTDLGGATPANDLVVQVMGVDGSGSITGIAYVSGAPNQDFSTCLSNWVALDYTANEGAPVQAPANNTNWFFSVTDQVDIMVTPNAEKVAKFHTHNIPAGSPYKGINKQLMIAILAKSKGLMWSAWQGLYNRDATGKKADFITDDLAEIAGHLLGVKDANKLGSVESILSSLPKTEADELLANLKWGISGASLARLARMHGAKSPMSMDQLHENAEFVAAVKQIGLIGKSEADLFA